VDLRLACGLALGAALGCLPESSDLSEYSAEWAEADDVLAGAGGSFGGLAGAGVGGSPTSPAGEGSGGTQQVDNSSGEGLGGAVFVPVGNAGASSSEGGSAGSPPVVGAGGAPALPPEPPGVCSDGVLVAEQQRCYFVSTEAATWDNARLACIGWEGELVKVESAAEDELLQGMVVESIWLGASDTAVDNVYVWTDGSPILFGNWGPQQPDAFAGSVDCVEKRAAQGSLWFDQPCDAAHLFICEKTLD
jgi:hypothetical protein